ncbi:MAG: hypothetical protein WEA24_04570 [Gemmatimonadota bacterium]
MLYSIVLGCLAAAPPLAAQQCPAGRPPAGDFGIRAVRCTGPAASCAINVPIGSNDGVRHEFAVEPVITAVAEETDLRVGDALVAVDGLLITTAAGGERLAGPRVGAAVLLLVRREGALLEIRMTAVRGCGIGSLRVSR